MLKATLKYILTRCGVFPIARLVYRRLSPEIVRLRRREVRLYQGILKRNSLCFDIGANLGQKSDIFLSAGFRSIVIEPNEYCQESLRLQFGSHPRAEILQKAIGSKTGKLQLYANGSDAAASLLQDWHRRVYGSDCNATPQIVDVVTLDDLIAAYGRPDYVKIDVEGYENEVLRGLTTPLPLISIEFHSEQMQMTTECIKTLSRFGHLKLRPTDMFGNWLCEQSDDLNGVLEFIRRTQAKGDLYIWMQTQE